MGICKESCSLGRSNVYQQVTAKDAYVKKTDNGTVVYRMSPTQALDIAQTADSTISFNPNHYSSASLEEPSKEHAKDENGFIIKLNKSHMYEDGRHEKNAKYIAFENCKKSNEVNVKEITTDNGTLKTEQVQILGGTKKLPFLLVKKSESKGFAIKDGANESKSTYLNCFDTPDICMQTGKTEFTKAAREIPRFVNGKLIHAFPFEDSCPPNTKCK